MKKICIFGAGAFAREVYATVERSGFEVECFIDQKEGSSYNSIPIKTMEYFSPAKHKAVLAVGHADLKLKILNDIKNSFGDVEFPVIIDPSVILENKKTIELAKGIVFCPNNVLTCDIKIDEFVHLNLSCTVGHNCNIGKFCQFSPGVNISGNNNIGNSVYFGTGSCSVENISVCDDVIIGAGGVVAKNITESGTYVGVPVKRIK